MYNAEQVIARANEQMNVAQSLTLAIKSNKERYYEMVLQYIVEKMLSGSQNYYMLSFKRLACDVDFG